MRLVARRNRFTVEATLAAPPPHGPQAPGHGPAPVRGQAPDRGLGPAPDDPEASLAAGALLRLHLPNSGRMTELLEPGALGLAALRRAPTPTTPDNPADPAGHAAAGHPAAGHPAAGHPAAAHTATERLAPESPKEPLHRTAGTLLVVRYAGRWVSVDARMPNRLFARCLEEDCLAPFRGYRTWRAEVRWGRSRVDFLLEAPDRPPCLVETKSCNLVEDGLALFPDAPTTRGTRHLRELAEAVQAGRRAAVVWFVQRDDATALAAHRRADPDFAQALASARAAGVEAYAYRCRVGPSGVQVLGPIPVRE